MVAEFDHYLRVIADLRGQVKALIADLPADALNWRLKPGVDDHAMNSLAVLAGHIACAEHFWIAEVVGGNPVTRNRSAEFITRVDGPTALLQRLDAVGRETGEVFAGLTAPGTVLSDRARRRFLLPQDSFRCYNNPRAAELASCARVILLLIFQITKAMQMDTTTLDQAIDTAMKLPFEQREMLVEIIHRRQIEAHRKEIAESAQTALAAFRAGQLKPQSAEDVIRELRKELENSE